MAVNRELSDQVDNVLNDVTKTCDQISKLMHTQKALITAIRIQITQTGDVTSAKPYLHSFETMLLQEVEQAQKMYDQIRKLNSAL